MRLEDSPELELRGSRGAPEGQTKDRILQSAVRLFAERGFDQVAVRDITDDAKVNPAAISYHFGSKEGLIRTTLGLVFSPINRERLRGLEDLRASSGGRADIGAVVRALVAPTASASQAEGYGSYYARFAVLAYALRRPFIDEALSSEHDTVAREFIRAFSEALPGVDRERICWCYDFAIGAIIHILLDRDRGHRLAALSNGLCDTDDPERITEQLVSFIVGGMKARPAPASAPTGNGKAARSKPRSKSKPSTRRSR